MCVCHLSDEAQKVLIKIKQIYSENPLSYKNTIYASEDLDDRQKNNGWTNYPQDILEELEKYNFIVSKRDTRYYTGRYPDKHWLLKNE